MKIKIFEGTEESVYKDCVKEGYTPATMKQTHNLIIEKRILDQWYNVAEIRSADFKIRKITKKECLNLKKFIEDGGRVSCLNLLNNDYDFYASDRNVDDYYGRLVGVKSK